MEVEKPSAISDQPEAGSQKPEAGSQYAASSIQLPAFSVQHLAPSIELLLAVVAGALWHLEGGPIWHAGSWPGPWPLILLGLLWASRLSRSLGTVEGRQRLRPSVFTVPLVLFLASVGVSLWAAYDPAIALAKAWLIVGALGFYWALAGQPDLPHIYYALAFSAIFCVVLTVYFLMTHEWAAYPIKVPALTALGSAISAWLPRLNAQSIHPNVVGGLLAATLPLTVPLAALLRHSEIAGLGQRSRHALGVLGVVGLSVGLFGVVVSVSRGAWVALSATAGLWGLRRLLTRLHLRRPRLVMAAAIVAGSAIAVGCIALLVSGELTAVLSPAAGSLADRMLSAARDAVTNRLRVHRLSALLVRDTPFTGIGLGMFKMHFSVYALLIHVLYLQHSHSMLLDLAIEQGLLGPAVYLALVATAVAWQPDAGSRKVDASYSMLDAGSQMPAADPQLITHNWKLAASHIRLAALAAISVTLIHGIVDDPLYGSRGVLLFFVPFGLLAAVGRSAPHHTVPIAKTSLFPRSQPARSSTSAKSAVLPVVLMILLIGSVASLQATPGKALRAAWFANLGAVAEARVELNSYDEQHPSDPTMSMVRREQDLSQAIALFERALALDATNATANQRLTVIALAREDYAAGLVHMQKLWDAGRRDRVTRLLYGDALVDAGQVDEAVSVVQGLEFEQARLLGQAWAREHESNDPERGAFARQAAAQVGR